MRKTTIHSHKLLTGRHALSARELERPQGTDSRLDDAIDQLNNRLKDLEQRCQRPDCDLKALSEELSEQLHRVGDFCRAMETELADPELIRCKQAEFRRRTDLFFSQSFLVNRARTWPRGYPGDYEIIDAVYDNQVRSAGIGHLFDRYFLRTTLAQAIQQRREKMRDMLSGELRQRPGAQVLNIGCGPCREVLELAPLIQQYDAHFTNVDFDSDALLFSAQRLSAAGIADHVRFRQYNALRMVNAKKNISEFGQFDVIYTIGLLDYLSDEVLVRMIKALYATLKRGGVFIAVFKDADQYTTEDYHWFSDWAAFLQRSARASRALLRDAGIPGDAVTTSRTPDNVMVFYHAVQNADTTISLPRQGPHDRRQVAHRADADGPESRQDRPARPSWRRNRQTR